jgi:phosphatidylserine/phosphatidylglycerophosphate/cardiolipin synthase-like enzyme
VCTSCGAQLVGRGIICPKCLTVQPPSTITPSKTQTSQSRTSNTKKLIALSVILLLIGAAIGAIATTTAAHGTNTTTTIRNTTTELTSLTVTNNLTATTTSTQAGTPNGTTATTTITTTTTAPPNTTATAGSSQIVEHCFSPGGNCDQVVVKWINSATVSVHVLIYSFTLQDIAQALVNAKTRGIDVKIVMDTSESKGQGSQYQFLLQNCQCIKLYTPPGGILHDKVAIIDGTYILEGSYNWSNAATKYNRENLIVINSLNEGQAYEQQFQQVWSMGS